MVAAAPVSLGPRLKRTTTTAVRLRNEAAATSFMDLSVAVARMPATAGLIVARFASSHAWDFSDRSFSGIAWNACQAAQIGSTCLRVSRR